MFHPAPPEVQMLQPAQRLVLTGLLLGALLVPANAAEREDVRKAINLVTSVKMPYPEHLTRNRAKTERVWLEREGATTGCIRLDDRRWCYEHIPPIGIQRPPNLCPRVVASSPLCFSNWKPRGSIGRSAATVCGRSACLTRRHSSMAVRNWGRYPELAASAARDIRSSSSRKIESNGAWPVPQQCSS